MLARITRRTARRGFTLLELIVTVLVLAVLAAVAIPAYTTVQGNTVAASVTTTGQSIARAANAAAASGANGGRVTSSDVQTAALEAFGATSLPWSGDGRTATLSGTATSPILTLQQTSGSLCRETRVTRPADSTLVRAAQSAWECGDVAVPGTVAFTTVSAGDASAALAWSAPEGLVDGYYLAYRTGTGEWTQVDTAGVSSSLTGLTNGVTYEVRVAAYNPSGVGAWSSTATVTPFGAPLAIAFTTATATNATVSLTWTAPGAGTTGNPVTALTVQYCTSQTMTGCTTVPVATTSSGLSLPALTNGTGYWFRLVAANTVGSTPGPVTGPLTPIGDPSTPGAVTGTGTNGQVALTWTALGDGTAANPVTHVKVERCTDGAMTGGCTLSAALAGSTSSLTMAGLTNGTPYYFRVLSYNTVGAGTGPTSDPVTPITTPAQPGAAVTAPGDMSVALDWSDVTVLASASAPITGVRVQYCTNAGMTAGCATTAILPAPTVTTTVTGLTNGTTYFFRLQNVNAAYTSNGPVGTGVTPMVPLSVSYASVAFTSGSDLQQVSPTVAGGFGAKSYAYTGTLPTGVTFSSSTGAFTGPASDAWNMRATAIDANAASTCALLTTGIVKCWGANSLGQLGDATTTDSTTPVTVSGLSGVTQLSSGQQTNCALKSDGTVWCWGWGAAGRLGNGGTANSSTPVQVTGLTDVTQVDSGGQTSCALKSDDTVWCWGAGASGALGNGGTANATTPVQVTGITTATQVSAGGANGCAVLSDSTVSCWGLGTSGQLGNNTVTTSTTPVTVSDISTATQVSAGNTATCARLSDGTGRCWGANIYGQTGDGTTTGPRKTPVTVTGLSTIATISTNGNHTCAALSDGTARCWGLGTSGQLGYGNTSTRSTPQTVTGLTGASGITTATGGNHSCAYTATGTVWCWGGNAAGQLGDDNPVSSVSSPVAALGFGPLAGFPFATRVTVTDSSGAVFTDITLAETA